MKVRILGCGGSGGVPLASGSWGDCDPANPRNLRTRPSILVEQGDFRVLVDTGPDMRMQLVAAGAGPIDAIFYTHAHADHAHGIDDVRALNNASGRVLDAYGSAATMADLQARFAYVFRRVEPRPGNFYIHPQLIAHVVDGPFHAGPFRIVPFDQAHGRVVSTGYRFGPFAYSTDVAALEEEAFAALEGVAVWVVDCLRFDPHPTHAHFERTMRWIERVKPRLAVLTHMNHTLDYDTVSARLPPGVVAGYDGMEIDVTTYL